MKFLKFAQVCAATAVLAFSGQAAAADAIVVGGKNFTEQQIMAEMTSQLLRAKGYSVDTRAGMGSAVLRKAQESGLVDVYWEYTGTSLIVYNKVTEPLSAQAVYDRVKQLDAAKGLVWLDPSKANNTYALAMRKQAADDLGLATISDLAGAVNQGKNLSFAVNAEFYARADGLKPLQETYGFEFKRADIKRMDTGLTYQALRDKQVDVALVFATDGRIPAFDFVVLQDDKGFFPSYALTPVVRQAVLDKQPTLADDLNRLSAVLDDQTMASLNARVDVDHQSIDAVCQAFLKEKGLI
ncbi:glycine betaine ABC transporter substrate-binding protein [Castellaniella hirudinis]|uniref:glycine betaine ABC transporter substrate-binding protein n=1 Tax=Castellaniella hirudinis TaxID=1144617 RepID=UPI0039C3F7D1